MGIFFGWLIFSIVVGAIGSNRKIGFFMAFIASIFLSPLIGLIITLVSKDKSEEKYKQELIDTLKQTQINNDKKENENNTISSNKLNYLKRQLNEYIEKKTFLTSNDSTDILSPSEIESTLKDISEKIIDLENKIEQREKQGKLKKAFELNLISEEVYLQKKKELPIDDNNYILLSSFSEYKRREALQYFNNKILESDVIVINKQNRKITRYSIEDYKKEDDSLFLEIIID